MKIGVNTWVWTSPFSTKEFDLIPKVREMGFDILEVALEDVSIIDAKLLRKMTEDNGLAVTVCGAFGPTRDVSSDDPAIRKNGADYMRESIRFAEQVGARIFAGPVYSAVGKTRLVPDEQKKREWAWCVEKLREVGKAATEAGVTIGVEPLNRFETDMINLAEQAVKLVRDVGSPAYKIHLDTFHGNIEEKSIPDAIRKLGKGMLCHFHACENDRGIPGHRPPGLDRNSRGAARGRVRRRGGHRVLHPRYGGDRQGGVDLAAACAESGRVGETGSALPPRVGPLTLQRNVAGDGRA